MAPLLTAAAVLFPTAAEVLLRTAAAAAVAAAAADSTDSFDCSVDRAHAQEDSAAAVHMAFVVRDDRMADIVAADIVAADTVVDDAVPVSAVPVSAVHVSHSFPMAPAHYSAYKASAKRCWSEWRSHWSHW